MRRALPALLFFCAGCTVTVSVGDTPDELWTELRLGATNNNQIDLLFMVDNSPSMAPKQAELRTRFPLLLQALQDNADAGHPAHYHIGVVTSDLGAGMANINGQCRPGGDFGRLQAIGSAAPATCGAFADGTYYLDLDQVNHLDNLPMGEDATTAFNCMTSVGDTGCGFEMPLESVYQALQNPPPENAGFLRDGALLVVVFLTDEDDCSAPPDTDLFDPGPQYGALLSYRCTQYGIVCGTPPSRPPYGESTPPLDGCAPAPNLLPTDPGKLFDVSRYVNFFRLPRSAGGVKEFPADVVLFAIDAPPTPFSVLDADLHAPPGPYQACTIVDGVNCGTVLQHSCINARDTSRSGDPSVRLSAVLSTTQTSASGASICDDTYAPALSSLASTLISYQSGDGCIPGPIPDASDPSCRVFDEIGHLDGTVQRNYFEECDRVAQSPPCWSVRPSTDCKAWMNQATGEVQTLKLALDRGGQPPPDGATTRAACVILTH